MTDTDELNRAWKQATDDEVIKAVTKDWDEYPSHVQAVIRSEANNRGLWDELASARSNNADEVKANIQNISKKDYESSKCISFSKITLDENEHIVASLVPDNPEQLYKHRNQVAALTNKRLLYTRFIGHKRSLEDCYTIVSIDLQDVLRVRQEYHLAVGGLLVGIISLLTGIYIAYCGITFQLIGPGVIFIPLLMIPFGIALIFGLKRRVLVFETTIVNYKWMSGPLDFRKTGETAASVCEYFDAPRENKISGKEPWLAEQSLVTENFDLILWYHYVIVILFPYVGIFWGIVNLIRRRTRSGLLLLLGSIIWYVIVTALIITLVSLQK